MMTIGIDASRANNPQKTGVEWYAFFLIEELKKITSPETKVILYSEKPLAGELAILPPNWQSKVLKWPPKRFWTQIRLSFEMLIHAPDVLFVPAHVFPIIHPRKTVMTVHDVAALRFSHIYTKFEKWYSLWSAKYAAKKLWKVIVPSIFTKNEIHALTGKTENITVIHHAYNKSYNQHIPELQRNAVLEKYQIQKPFLLYIGRLEEKKNIVRIVEAFDAVKKDFSDLHLVLIGKPGYGFEQVQERIRKSAHQSDILCPGYVEQSDIHSILQSTKIFLFPTLYEGFGIPVLEAFASSVPVLTSKYHSTEEISGGAALLVDPLDTEDIKKGIEKLLHNPELQKQYIAQGLKQTENFSWEKCAQQTLNLLLSK